eukprot:gene408-513_t
MAVATVGYLAFGASMALGAFLAGMVVAQSKVSHQAAADALPMRDAFAVLFFVSVGMMFDVREILREPGLVLGLLAVVLIAKPVAALAIVQSRGDLIEAAFLLRAYRNTLSRFAACEPLDTGAMRVQRRISATYKDLPGGQVLGPTYDYTQRLLDFSLLASGLPASASRAP